MIEIIVLGMYLPIVACASYASWLFITRLIWPSIQKRSSLDNYIIGISATFALLAHAAENAFYGLIRLFPERLYHLNQQLIIVGAWKALILASCTFALAGLMHAETGAAHLKQIAKVVLVLWVLGSFIAWWIE